MYLHVLNRCVLPIFTDALAWKVMKSAVRPFATDRIIYRGINAAGNAIASVHAFVRPFVYILSSEPTDR